MALNNAMGVRNLVLGFETKDLPNSKFYVERELSIENSVGEMSLTDVNGTHEEVTSTIDKIRSIETNTMLRAKVKHALDNWIGTRISNLTPETLEVFLTTLQRELIGDDGNDEPIIQKIRQECSPALESSPHIKLTFNDVNLQSGKTSKKNQIQFMVGEHGQPSTKLNLEDNKSKPQKVFYENIENDELIVNLFNKMDLLIGRASIALRDIQPGELINLPLENSSEKDESIGTVQVQVDACNQDKDSVKVIILQLFQDMLFKNFIEDIFDSTAEPQEIVEDVPKFEYYVQITETQKEDPNCLFVKNASTQKIRSKVKFNNSTVSLKSTSTNRCKIENLAEDWIKIKLIDSSPTQKSSTLGYMQKNLEDINKGFSPLKKSSYAKEKKRKMSLDEMKNSLMQTLPKNKSAEKSPKLSPRMDPIIFSHKIVIADIPWSEGLSVSHGDYTWTFKIIAENVGQPKPVLSEDDLTDLLTLAYNRTLCQIESLEGVATWPGFLMRSYKLVQSCLQPFNNLETWQIAHSRAIFTVQKNRFHDLNLKVLMNHLSNLPTGDLLDSYKNWLMVQIASFDARDQTNFNHLSRVVECLALLLTDQSKLTEEELDTQLSYSMRSYIEKVFKMGTNWSDTTALTNQQISFTETLSGYGNSTLALISMRFGNFGLNTWCPLLAEVLIDVSLQRFQTIFQQYSTFSWDSEDSNEFHQTSFHIFKELCSLSRYLPSVPASIYDTFEDCLPFWAKCAAFKAEEQVLRVLEMERDVHEIKDPSEMAPKKTRAQSVHPWLKVEESLYSPPMTISRRLSNDEYFEWLQGAIDVNGILRSCNITWQHLEWPDPVKSITKFGCHLFIELHRVFNMYMDGLKEIIMADKKFDRAELVFVLHSCFQSMNFLELFSKSLASEMQRVADQMSEKSDKSEEESRKHENRKSGELSHIDTLTDALEKFCFVKTNAEEEAANLVTMFCEGQREYFAQKIRIQTFDSSNSEESFSSTLTASNYLESLLHFFKYKLKLGLDNEDRTDKYYGILEKELFEVYEDELKKYCDSVSLNQSQDVTVFESLNEIAFDTMELRRNFSLDESDILQEIFRRASLKTAPSSGLISAYLEEVHKKKRDLARSHDEVLGQIVFQAGIIETRLLVHLGGVSNLIPRPNREELNFNLEVSVLPLKDNDSNYKLVKKTLAYPHKNNHLFDMEDEGGRSKRSGKKSSVDSKNFNFEFDLTNAADIESAFLEICLFDYSSTKTYKVFRGNCLISLSEIPQIESRDALQNKSVCRRHEVFTRIPNLSDESKGPLSELQERKDSPTKEFVAQEEKYRKGKKICHMPKSEDWADNSILPMKPPGARCLFPMANNSH